MIHPSYNELIAKINEGNENGENPEINSRYSIVMAAAKRARQIIDGDEPTVEGKIIVNKPLSLAVKEIEGGHVHIVEEGVDDFQFIRKQDTTSSLVYDEDPSGSDQIQDENADRDDSDMDPDDMDQDNGDEDAE